MRHLVSGISSVVPSEIIARKKNCHGTQLQKTVWIELSAGQDEITPLADLLWLLWSVCKVYGPQKAAGFIKKVGACRPLSLPFTSAVRTSHLKLEGRGQRWGRQGDFRSSGTIFDPPTAISDRRSAWGRKSIPFQFLGAPNRHAAPVYYDRGIVSINWLRLSNRWLDHRSSFNYTQFFSSKFTIFTLVLPWLLKSS